MSRPIAKHHTLHRPTTSNFTSTAGHQPPPPPKMGQQFLPTLSMQVQHSLSSHQATINLNSLERSAGTNRYSRWLASTATGGASINARNPPVLQYGRASAADTGRMGLGKTGELMFVNSCCTQDSNSNYKIVRAHAPTASSYIITYS